MDSELFLFHFQTSIPDLGVNVVSIAFADFNVDRFVAVVFITYRRNVWNDIEEKELRKLTIFYHGSLLN